MAGIGLGHLLGREDDSTPQSGVDAPRLLKTEPPQIVLLLFLLLFLFLFLLLLIVVVVVVVVVVVLTMC